MPFPIFSIQEAIDLGRFVLAAYDLFARNDPPGFAPPGGYTLVVKLYADDITDNVPTSRSSASSLSGSRTSSLRRSGRQ